MNGCLLKMLLLATLPLICAVHAAEPCETTATVRVEATPCTAGEVQFVFTAGSEVVKQVLPYTCTQPGQPVYVSSILPDCPDNGILAPCRTCAAASESERAAAERAAAGPAEPAEPESEDAPTEQQPAAPPATALHPIRRSGRVVDVKVIAVPEVKWTAKITGPATPDTGAAASEDGPPRDARNVHIVATGRDWLTVAWDHSPSPDVVAYYYSFGKSCDLIEMGYVTQATLQKLKVGMTYDFVLTARDASGQSSWDLPGTPIFHERGLARRLPDGAGGVPLRIDVPQ